MQPNLGSSINLFSLGEVNLKINQIQPKKVVRAKASWEFTFSESPNQEKLLYPMYYKIFRKLRDRRDKKKYGLFKDKC